MGASRTPVGKELKMECGCWYMYSPDTFSRGERMFECTHGKMWLMRAIPGEVTYVVEDMTPVEEDDEEGRR